MSQTFLYYVNDTKGVTNAATESRHTHIPRFTSFLYILCIIVFLYNSVIFLLLKKMDKVVVFFIFFGVGAETDLMKCQFVSMGKADLT